MWQRKFEKPRLILRGVTLIANMMKLHPQAASWLLTAAAQSFGEWIEELMSNDRVEAAEERAGKSS